MKKFRISIDLDVVLDENAIWPDGDRCVIVVNVERRNALDVSCKSSIPTSKVWSGET